MTYRDGSVLAQLSAPICARRSPCLWPGRPHGGPDRRLDLAEIATLSSKRLTRRDSRPQGCERCHAPGGTAPAIMNAANEIAVEAFLNKRIGFLDIARTGARDPGPRRGQRPADQGPYARRMCSRSMEKRGLWRDFPLTEPPT